MSQKVATGEMLFSILGLGAGRGGAGWYVMVIFVFMCKSVDLALHS
jgi:hypothetical protein